MAFMIWNNNFKVNIKEIDLQHKKLFDMVNDLHDAMKTGTADEILKPILENMLLYCNTHFATEEKYMILYNYPDFIAHKKAHDDLTTKTKQLYEKLKNRETVLSFDLMIFLKDWLNNHILNVDKKMGSFINSKISFL